MPVRPSSSQPDAEVVRSEERLRVGTQSVATERVVLRRTITEQVRQVEVVVRREELQVERLPADGADVAGRTGAAAEPLVIVLSEEVPVVSVHTRPYERVTVHVDRVQEEQQVTETLRSERVETDTGGLDRT